MGDLQRQRAVADAGAPGRVDAGRRASLTCPACGAATVETMPTDQCLYFHECRACRSLLRPKPGDCCVFCSYGDRPCPPKASGGCCA